MRPKSIGATLLQRSFLLFLVALLSFASYRPAIHLLFLATLAQDDDEESRLAPVKNLPRPTRQQMRTIVHRVERKRLPAISPGKDSPHRLVLRTGPDRLPAPAAGETRLMSTLTAPDSLRLLLTQLPYNHLSPPV